jgi:hypothetical protein
MPLEPVCATGATCVRAYRQNEKILVTPGILTRENPEVTGWFGYSVELHSCALADEVLSLPYMTRRGPVARSVRTLFLVASVAIVTAFGVVAQAQTCTTPEAQLTSPADGSTLVPDPVTGLVTFTWCNASADYFVTIETFPGAHDLFFNFVGGEGGGFTSMSLSPSCLPTLPRGCIPPNGEHLTFGLQTTKAKQLLGPAHRYSFTAPTASSTKPDFAITSSKATLAIPAAGGSASTSVTVTGQAGYNGIVNFSCSGLPANSSCSFTPLTVASGGNTTMTIATAARQAAALKHPRLDWLTSIAGSACAVVLIVGVPAQRRKRIGLWSAILLLVVLGSMLSFIGCGGAAAPKQAPVTTGTPAGTFTVTVTASDGVLTHTTAVTLAVP